ncbi:MAG: DHA1 family bicyclomycin/chloramphenicol resistance-like MFS transporter [Lentimonas sp.]|jgi:DHA1 family bicyclomycin/chloramphenicol resistance-like MFS transporter
MTKRSFIFLIITLGSLVAIGPLAIDMYLPAFSKIAQFFDAPDSKVQLTLSSYFIGIAVAQIFYGPAIDRFGKKPPLIFGLILFVIASYLCIIASSINEMILWRFFQAAGACSCFVVMRAIVRDLFSTKESAQVLSYLLLVMGIAPILAPIFGAIILDYFDWQAIFWFLALFGLLLILVTVFYLPESRGGNKNEKISQSFKKYQEIISDKNFLFYSLAGGFSACGMFVYITGAPYVLIEVFNLTPKAFSWVFSINALGYVAVAQINARFLKFFELHQVLNNAFKISLTAAIALIICGVYFANLITISIALFVYIALIGAITPSSTALALSNQKKHSGSASALFGSIQFTICAFGALLISKFHNGTALPMMLAMASCGITAFFINYYWQKICLKKN